MIVVDASAVLELLLPSDQPSRVRSRLQDEWLHAPHLLDVEVVQVIRRYLHREQITQDIAEAALSEFFNLRIRRHGHQGLLPRVWSLRRNLTAYDATYVALAEALNAILLTTDGKLLSAPGHRAQVEIV